MHFFNWQFKRLKCYLRVPKCPKKDRNDCLCVSVGAQCCVELHSYAEAIQWCDEGLRAHPADKKLLELRASADKRRVCILKYLICFCWRLVGPINCNVHFFQRAAERDARKAKHREKKLHDKEEALRTAIKVKFRWYI